MQTAQVGEASGHPDPNAQLLVSRAGLAEMVKEVVKEALKHGSPSRGRTHKRGKDRHRRSHRRRAQSPSSDEDSQSSYSTRTSSSRSKGKRPKRLRPPSSDEESVSTLTTKPHKRDPILKAREFYQADQELSPQSDSEDDEDMSGDEDRDQKGQFKVDRLCPTDLYFRVMAKAASALDLEVPQAPPVLQTQTSRAKAYPRRKPKAHTVPFPEALDDVFDSEWGSLHKHRQQRVFDRLYTLPPQVMKKLQVPTVDAPVVAVSNATTLPTEGESGPKDVCDRRTEGSMKRAFENASHTFRASVASSVLSRAIMVWIEELASSDKSLSRRAKATLKKVACSAAAAADCAYDAIQMTARGMANTVSARRQIWLRHWQGDPASSSRILNLPFKGEKLFGEELDPLLVEDAEKRKVLPSKKQLTKKQPFRGYTSSLRPKTSFQGNKKWNKAKNPYRYKKGGTASTNASGKPKQDQQTA